MEIISIVARRRGDQWPAVNRQPGFRRGNGRADSTKEAREHTHAHAQTQTHTHHRIIETQTYKTSQRANRRTTTHVDNNSRNITRQLTNHDHVKVYGAFGAVSCDIFATEKPEYYYTNTSSETERLTL